MIHHSLKITIEYEFLCKIPIETIEHLGKLFGTEISKQDKEIPDSFPNGNVLKYDKTIFERFQYSLENFKLSSV